MSDPKPQLHVSMLNTMTRCGIQFQRRYGERFGIWHQEEILLPGVALLIGSSTHVAVEKTLTYKMETGELPPIQEAQEAARDAVVKATHSEILLTDEEAQDVKKTINSMIDTTVGLTSVYHAHIAPDIEPIAIEEPFVIELKDYPIDLAGRIDCREVGIVRDTKTAARTPKPELAKSLQMAMYSMARKVIDGEYPDKVALDYLVKLKTPKAVTIEALPHDGWIKPLRYRIERFVEIVDAVKSGKQALTPANPDDWACTKKYCGYAATCPFWSGR